MSLGIPSGRLQGADHSPLRGLFVQAVRMSGLTHAEIARRAGLSRSTVSFVLNGRRTGTLDTWHAILGAAGVQLAAKSAGRVLRVDLAGAVSPAAGAATASVGDSSSRDCSGGSGGP